MRSFEAVRRTIWRELDEALKRGASNWEVRLNAFALAALREIRSKTDDARLAICPEVLYKRERAALAARVSTQIEREIVAGGRGGRLCS